MSSTELGNYSVSDALQRGNRVVFMDIAVGSTVIGRLKMELFYDITPKVRTSDIYQVNFKL